ncbi:hypothetical protein [Rufibacter sp. LB8]|uniref:hypothetical protein n=1 Tax=Rufibacter sp. LB8 TaxID=2777781 RepID=UPI00178C2AFA|nr:hypothetical protein [Rufibacter sp. LB8]
MKIGSQLSGVAGEYYVAAELSRRGYLAAITLRNSDGVDILVSSLSGENMISIQVKTTQGKKKWILNKKVEEVHSKNKFFIFVSLPIDRQKCPEYFIVNSTILANKIKSGHEKWEEGVGRNGQKRNKTDVRQFNPESFKNELVGSWEELIKLIESGNPTLGAS